MFAGYLVILMLSYLEKSMLVGLVNRLSYTVVTFVSKLHLCLQVPVVMPSGLLVRCLVKVCIRWWWLIPLNLIERRLFRAMFLLVP